MRIVASEMTYRELNDRVRNATEEVTIEQCFGERFIGVGAEEKRIVINGTPGNALGAYLNGGTIVVNGNAQDAVGDTMNDGTIAIYGNAGDALGYAMRGGKIFVQGNAGYRTGIHMKQYKEKQPTIVVGEATGSFLGEYLAGGLIIVLGLSCTETPVGNFVGTGMHGGAIYLRTEKKPAHLPKQVTVKKADEKDLKKIQSTLEEYAKMFKIEIEEIFSKPFYLLTPNAKSPYKQLYTEN